ncbi:MAG: hypothetical protein ABFS12_06415 [Bacteroidota bacterium]
MKKISVISFLIIISSSLFAQSNKSETLISVKGTTINNIGEIKEIWETGSAIYLNYENLSSNHFSYIFQAGYINFKENSNHNFNINDAHFNIIPLQVGGRYYILLNTFRPFLMAMGGANIIDSNYPILRINHEEEEVIVMESGTHTRLNFQIGLGLAIKLFSSLQVEVIANYNSHVMDAPVHYNITGFELGAGLSWVIKN